jgi:hypothetical protein
MSVPRWYWVLNFTFFNLNHTSSPLVMFLFLLVFVLCFYDKIPEAGYQTKGLIRGRQVLYH